MATSHGSCLFTSQSADGVIASGWEGWWDYTRITSARAVAVLTRIRRMLRQFVFAQLPHCRDFRTNYLNNRAINHKMEDRKSICILYFSTSLNLHNYTTSTLYNQLNVIQENTNKTVIPITRTYLKTRWFLWRSILHKVSWYAFDKQEKISTRKSIVFAFKTTFFALL